MRLQLPKSHEDSFQLNLTTGMALLAGPNAVGKTYLLKTAVNISGNNPNLAYSPRLQLPRPPISIDDQPLIPILITADDVRSVTVEMQAQRQSFAPNTVFEQINQQLREEEQEIVTTRTMLDVLTADEKKRFKLGSAAEKNDIARNVEVRLTRTSLKNLVSSAYLYHKAFNRLALRNIDEHTITQQIGPPPWKLVNSAFESLGLPYRFDPPDLRSTWFEDASYILRDIRIDRPVDGESFSAGERVLLALCELLLSDNRLGRKLYLLDDIDGLLHAPALRQFIDFIQETLVHQQGHIALWATHSPVTVQLAREADLFFISSRGESPTQISRAELTDRLSGGELVVLDNTVMVFVEGQDHEFYNGLFRRLELDRMIQVTRSVRFISPTTDPHSGGGGRDAVPRAVAALIQSGFSKLAAGLVDGDGRTSSPGVGVERLPRYSVENYWLDPLNVYAWFLDHEIHAIPTELTFHGVSSGMGSKITSALNQQQLQKVVDYWANVVSERWEAVIQANAKAASVDAANREDVLFVGGLSLNYPTFLLHGPGKEIMANAYRDVDTRLNRNTLKKQYFVTAAWPVDLIELVQKFSTSQ